MKTKHVKINSIHNNKSFHTKYLRMVTYMLSEDYETKTTWNNYCVLVLKTNNFDLEMEVCKTTNVARAYKAWDAENIAFVKADFPNNCPSSKIQWMLSGL